MKPQKDNIVIFKPSQNKPYIGTARIKSVKKGPVGNLFKCRLIGINDGEIGKQFYIHSDEIISCMTEQE